MWPPPWPSPPGFPFCSIEVEAYWVPPVIYCKCLQDLLGAASLVLDITYFGLELRVMLDVQSFWLS